MALRPGNRKWRHPIGSETREQEVVKMLTYFRVLGLVTAVLYTEQIEVGEGVRMSGRIKDQDSRNEEEMM